MNNANSDSTRTWLAALPFWRDDGERRAFIEDLCWQLGDRDCDPSHGTPTEAAQALIRRCLEPDKAPTASGPARALLFAALRDRGLVDGVPENLVATSVDERPRWKGKPFPGPRPFRTSEAPIFFGRGMETRALLRLLSRGQGEGLIIVAGQSACGKTSLVQAGLLASLARGGIPELPNSEFWPVALMRLTADPADPCALLAEALAATGVARVADARHLAGLLNAESQDALKLLTESLRERPSDTRWLLVVDGLEQVFAASSGPGGRLLLDLLQQLLTLPRLHVVATLNADFLGNCVEHPLLRSALNRGGLLTLPTPTRAQLMWMLQAPMKQLELDAPLRMAPTVAEALVSEALTRPAPLLHLAARAPQGCLPWDAVADRIAGFRPAPRLFDDVCDTALADVDAGPMPRLFSRLVCVGEAGAPVARSEALAHWDADPAARQLIDTLSKTKPPLLRIDADAECRVELAHGGLLRSWERLSVWIEQRRESMRLEQRLRAALAAWQLAGRPDDLRWPHERLAPAHALLAAADRLDRLRQDRDMDDFLKPEAEWLLAEVQSPGTDDARREDIGLRLARIGDPRPGVLDVDGCPAPHWCDIPGGSVLIDGRTEVGIAPFRLAAYPVTMAQFNAFLSAADGFNNDDWWHGLQRRPLAGRSLAQRGNFPVTRVSWHDAVAFCRWLSARLGVEVRLPDEWEWQWAAQSARPDFVYPWGPDWLPGRANTDEAGLGRVTAVGMYPPGQSRQGVSDLAGNIWEWCRNSFDVPRERGARPPSADGLAEVDSEQGAPRGARVIRGGSWRVNRGFARADFRLDAMPEDRVGSTGFRLACCSAADE